MASSTFIILLTLCFVNVLALSNGQLSEPTNDEEWKECPFNKEDCKCVNDGKHPDDPLIYAKAQCQSGSGQLPKFGSAEKGKYTVTGTLVIKGAELSKIPASHFAAFDTINTLSFKYNGTGKPAPIDWDERTFDGVTIIAMTTNGLAGFVPTPAALKNCRGLAYITVMYAPSPINLVDRSFNVPLLQSIQILQSEVKTISPKAFAGLENQLAEVRLNAANVSDLSALGTALNGFTRLERMYLQYNQITEIKRNDFQHKSRLVSASLQNNPVTSIESGSFSNLTNLRCVFFDNTLINSFDLALFADVKLDWIYPGRNNMNILFMYNPALKKLTTSVVDRFAKLGYAYIPSSGLEYIDPKIADLLNNVPDLTINIENSKNLICENLSWMSKVQCPERMVIGKSICADKNNQTLEAYLESVDPKSTCRSKAGMDAEEIKENLLFVC